MLMDVKLQEQWRERMEPLSIYNKGSRPGVGRQKGFPEGVTLWLTWEVKK